MRLYDRPRVTRRRVFSFGWGTVLFILLLQGLLVRGKESQAYPSTSLSKEWFHPQATVQPLTLHVITQTIHAVTVEGVTNGWIFQTDQVAPMCKGKRGEIVLLVGLGTNRLIKGVEVLKHQEDVKYFSRVKESFFRQFIQRSPETEPSAIDAVTSATRSSKAIREEVLLGSRVIASQPEVARQISPPLQKPRKTPDREW